MVYWAPRNLNANIISPCLKYNAMLHPRSRVILRTANKPLSFQHSLAVGLPVSIHIDSLYELCYLMPKNL
jgi:hypothetical protein